MWNFFLESYEYGHVRTSKNRQFFQVTLFKIIMKNETTYLEVLKSTFSFEMRHLLRTQEPFIEKRLFYNDCQGKTKSFLKAMIWGKGNRFIMAWYGNRSWQLPVKNNGNIAFFHAVRGVIVIFINPLFWDTAPNFPLFLITSQNSLAFVGLDSRKSRCTFFVIFPQFKF